MKKTFVLAVVLMAVMLSTVSMAQDKALALIPGDSAMVAEIDFPTLTEFMAKNKTMQEQAPIPPFVKQLMGKANKAYIGMPAEAMMGGQPEDFYAIITGNLKTAELVKMAKQVAVTEGKNLTFKNVNVAGLNAVKGGQEGEEDQDMLIADFPGGIVVGSEKGLAKFVSVKSGQAANASGNAALINVRKMIPGNYGVKFYGVPGNLSGMQVDALAFGVGLKKNDIMSLLLCLRSSDPAALQQINQSVMMIKGMAAMADESGKLAEIMEEMKVETKADGVDVSLDVPFKALEEISKSLAAQAGAGM